MMVLLQMILGNKNPLWVLKPNISMKKNHCNEKTIVCLEIGVSKSVS